MTRTTVFGWAIAAAASLAVVAVASRNAMLAPVVHAEARSTLPSAGTAKALLNATHRHREWMTVPVSASTSTLAWVTYPERTEPAPVVFLLNERRDADDWTRAIGDQLAAEGYLAVVPDAPTQLDREGRRVDAAPAQIGVAEAARRLEAVQRAVVALPSSQDAVFHVDVSQAAGRIQIRSAQPDTPFALSAEAWPLFVASLNRLTGNALPASAVTAHADHLAMQAQVRGAAAAPRNTIAEKDPRLPAGFYTARSTLRNTRLKSEWVDIPLEGSAVKLHTFIVYPATNAKTGVVLVMQHGVGLDEWQRRIHSVEHLRQAEVEHLHGAIVTDLDVRGLEVAVDDAAFMCGVQRTDDLARDGEGLVERQGADGKPIGHCWAFHQFQHERVKPRRGVLFDSADGRDVHVAE